MTTCQAVIEALDSFMPFDCVARKDNSGLLVGEPSASVDNVLFAVDLTEAVIEEAIRRQCQMIVTHHPIMGKGIRQVTPGSYEGRAVMTLIRHGIAFVVCHNNLDFLPGGTADTLMKAVGAPVSRPLYDGYGFLATTPEESHALSIPVPDKPGLPPGTLAMFGTVGELAEPCTLAELLRRLHGVVTGPVNVVGTDDRRIRSVAVQVGAGGRADIDQARSRGADLLITGDVRHDDRLYASEAGLALLDFCHYEVELPGIVSLAGKLQSALDQARLAVRIMLSEAPAPVRHLRMPDRLDPTRFALRTPIRQPVTNLHE
ncbi:Nif3-like dinuclear metal center hexameric protein [Paenibacillus sp. IB182496]|uniref:GTP cyclohydrolase 1 type 2 homolog n=1 Tax=Paenibacillus sabuli TaxID=2772509 RepID=A0A927BTM4_9BACL|nr:Nif3-like dinuclear metal center hexameric protein [Paenibacillus sabuli]MBD2846582.1 Nif3-like dinuclear metal center hexameric protein [Paenibacillus sabuli]